MHAIVMASGQEIRLRPLTTRHFYIMVFL